jgi:hypothetical protein
LVWFVGSPDFLIYRPVGLLVLSVLCHGGESVCVGGIYAGCELAKIGDGFVSHVCT